MSYLNSICDNFLKVFSFACFATLLLFILSCAFPLQEKQAAPTEVKKTEREEALPLVKPATPPVESPDSHRRATTQEIEAHDRLRIDSAPIER